MRNLYKVIGIASTADAGRIKSEFRRRAKAVHPDLNPGGERAEERFHELMQAYEVLRNDKARADYDALLASHRREARRRFAQSAGLMVATFVLTMVSGFSVMGLQGLNVHSQTWQIATAWLTSVEVEAQDGQAGNRTAEGAPFTTTVVASAVARSHSASDMQPPTLPDAASASSHGRKTAPEAAPRAQRRVAAAAPERKKAATADASGPESWMPWSSATDEQPSYYGLGASGL